MDSYPIRYEFSQTFDVAAEAAYRWCTDYRPDDWRRMGKKGTRSIQRINEDTLVLTDTYVLDDGSRVKRRRLIRMYPEMLTMVNTRLSAEGQHSQFIYRFVDEGEGRSRLDFTGAQVFRGEKPSPRRLASLAHGMAREDAEAWVHLAEAMEADLRPSTGKTRGKAEG